MVVSPRWRKVASDLWGNKTRTLLVVVSIAVGVFAVGMILGSRVILLRDLRAGYLATNPASGTIYTVDPFDDDLIEVVRHMRTVRDADGRRTTNVRYSAGPGRWRNLQLIALPDFEDIRVGKIRSLQGRWPPLEHEVLLERSSLATVGARVGDLLLVEAPNGTRRSLRVAGVAHDLSQVATTFTGIAYGYATFATLEWLGEPRDYNQLYFTVAERATEKPYIEQVARQIRDKIEKSGRAVLLMQVLDPGEHWSEDVLRAMVLLLTVLSGLSLLLSGFLVINTISALLAQQVRQIGIMKAVGGRAGQIIGMYMSAVLIFGALALFVAVPLGVLGAGAMAAFLAGFLNFDIGGYSLPPGILAVEVGTGLLVPLAAALYPAITGTRITVRQAIGGHGLGGAGGGGLVDRLVEQVRGLPRPVLLSLRNTFRRKGRLTLTLATLTLAGAMFVGVLSVRASLLGTLEDFFQYWNYDVQVEFSRSYRIERLEHEALSVPGAERAESWGYRAAHRLRADDTEGDTIFMVALPAGTAMLRPTLLQGRWLLPADENAVVINTELLRKEPDIKVGDEIILKIAGRKTPWRVVGLVRGIFTGPLAYGNYPYVSRVTRTVGQGERVQIVTARHDPAFAAEAAKALESHFRRVGLRLSSVQTTPDQRAQIAANMNVLVVFLLIMAVLLAVVGGLGLMGTMSMNVLERTREIGVMRAIGASDGAVLRVVLVEGILIGLLSWLVGTALAFPLGHALTTAVGTTMLSTTLTYVFSLSGAALWLVLVVLLAAAASFLPAWNASRLTVRDVLAYE